MAQRNGFNFRNAAKIIENTSTTVEETKAEVLDAPETEHQTMQDKIKKMDSTAEYEKAFIFKFIAREKIHFNSDNNFPISDVEKLAASILQNGLLHNLEVLYDEDQDNYIIESGERRTRAIDSLIDLYNDTEDKDTEEYKLYLKNVKQFAVEGYPCNVKKLPTKDVSLTEEEQTLADIDSQIRLREANFEVRDPNENIEIFRKELLKLKELYEEKNKLLKKGNKININQEIGAKLGITDRQVKNYAATAKLIPELQELLDKNNITLTEGVNYSKLTEEEQRQLLTIIEQGRPKEEVNALCKEIDRLNKEIKASEKELEKANADKDSTHKQLEAARAEVEEIRKELESSHNIDEVSSLNEQLKAAHDKLEETESKWRDTSSKQEQTIKELNAKLEEKKAATVTAVNTQALRLSFKIEDTMKAVEDSLKGLVADYKAYKKAYTEDSSMKSPEDFEKELRSILNKIKL